MATLKERLKAFVNPKQSAAVAAEPAPLERYYALCDVRDETYAKVKPLRAELELLNAQVQLAQDKANAKALEISNALGGKDWLTLKKEIAQLARSLGRIPPRK